MALLQDQDEHFQHLQGQRAWSRSLWPHCGSAATPGPRAARVPTRACYTHVTLALGHETRGARIQCKGPESSSCTPQGDLPRYCFCGVCRTSRRGKRPKKKIRLPLTSGKTQTALTTLFCRVFSTSVHSGSCLCPLQWQPPTGQS